MGFFVCPRIIITVLVNLHSAKAVTLEVGAGVLVLALLVAWGFFYRSGAGVSNNFMPVPTEEPVITLAGCVPSPGQVAFRRGVPVRFDNPDKTPHVVWFSPDVNFIVPAEQERFETFDQWQHPGMRYYMCDSRTRAGSLTMVASTTSPR